MAVQQAAERQDLAVRMTSLFAECHVNLAASTVPGIMQGAAIHSADYRAAFGVPGLQGDVQAITPAG